MLGDFHANLAQRISRRELEWRPGKGLRTDLHRNHRETCTRFLAQNKCTCAALGKPRADVCRGHVGCGARCFALIFDLVGLGFRATRPVCVKDPRHCLPIAEMNLCYFPLLVLAGVYPSRCFSPQKTAQANGPLPGPLRCLQKKSRGLFDRPRQSASRSGARPRTPGTAASSSGAPWSPPGGTPGRRRRRARRRASGSRCRGPTSSCRRKGGTRGRPKTAPESMVLLGFG